MKTVSKKLFSLLLVMVMLVSIVPFAASADPAVEYLCGTDPEHKTPMTWHPAVDKCKAGEDGSLGTYGYFTCDDCGTTKYIVDGGTGKASSVTDAELNSKPLVPHTWVEKTETAVAPTCDKPGKLPNKECSVCEEKLEGAEIPRLTAHTWPDPKDKTTWIKNDDPTTEHMGEWMQKCETCAAIRYLTEPEQSHTNTNNKPFSVTMIVNYPVNKTVSYTLGTEYVAGTQIDIAAAVAEKFNANGEPGKTLNGVDDGSGYYIISSSCPLCNISNGKLTVSTDCVLTVNVGLKENLKKLQFVATPGEWKEGSTTTDVKTVKDIQFGKSLSGKLPADPVREGYKFIGWKRVDEGHVNEYITPSTIYDWSWSGDDSNIPAVVAVWEADVKTLTVLGLKANAKGVVDPDQAPVKLLVKEKVPAKTNLLDLLASVRGDVRACIPDGYYWYKDSSQEFWYDYTFTAGQVVQSRNMDSDTTVCIKMYPGKITLTFDPNGGIMNNKGRATFTTMEVDYMEALPELPTPTWANKKFKGWSYNGRFWSKGDIFSAADATNVVFKAVWADEADIWLNIYINGDSSKAVRYVPLTQKELGDYVTQSDIMNALAKAGVVAKSGSSLNLHGGLYTEDRWADYLDNKNVSGQLGMEVSKILHQDVYVMVDNAVLTGGTGDTTPVTTKPTDHTLPKTGDTTMIYTAASVMVLAAAALVTVQVIRKKKSI